MTIVMALHAVHFIDVLYRTVRITICNNFRLNNLELQFLEITFGLDGFQWNVFYKEMLTLIRTKTFSVSNTVCRNASPIFGHCTDHLGTVICSC